MVFADDVILCCAGEFPAIYTMLKALKLFSATSGLQISEPKSSFYTAGVKVIKITIQILKSYDFTIQTMVDDSIRDSRRFYTFLLTTENLASLNHANKENTRYILLVIANIVGKKLFFFNF